MTLPTHIKIGGITYTVRVVDDLHDKHTPLLGWHKPSTCELLLDASLVPQAQYQVLWHEIVHGILTVAGFVEENQNERLIDALGYGMLQVLRDNPELKWYDPLAKGE